MVNFSLEGKVAFVTGASYGIGFAIAKADAETKSRALIEKRADLIIAMKDFSDSHRDEVFIDSKKSRDFVNGTIGYRQLPDKVEVTAVDSWGATSDTAVVTFTVPEGFDGTLPEALVDIELPAGVESEIPSYPL